MPFMRSTAPFLQQCGRTKCKSRALEQQHSVVHEPELPVGNAERFAKPSFKRRITETLMHRSTSITLSRIKSNYRASTVGTHRTSLREKLCRCAHRKGGVPPLLCRQPRRSCCRGTQAEKFEPLVARLVLPNHSLKRSANGVAHWPSGAGASPHFAPAVQRATPLSPA